MEYTGILEVLIGVGMMILLIVFSGILLSLSEQRKSKKYRKTIMDMYVSAKLKFLANEDGLDLTEEFESFKKWAKKERLNSGDGELDTVVEEELMERVSEPKKEKK